MARRAPPSGGKLARRLPRLALGLFGALPLAVLLLFLLLPVPATPLMLLRLLEGEGLSHSWVPYDAISPHLGPAILAAEDNAFCQHDGVDWVELEKSAEEVRKGRRDQQRGASTVSMQTVKNLLLWPGRDVIRKGLELTYVTWVEALWPKRRILEVYMNIAEWGPGIYGAEAAARYHFGVSAAKLSARQAALLAAVLPNPRGYDAGKPSDYVRNRASVIMRRAQDILPLLTCLR